MQLSTINCQLLPALFLVKTTATSCIDIAPVRVKALPKGRQLNSFQLPAAWGYTTIVVFILDFRTGAKYGNVVGNVLYYATVKNTAD